MSKTNYRITFNKDTIKAIRKILENYSRIDNRKSNNIKKASWTNKITSDLFYIPISQKILKDFDVKDLHAVVGISDEYIDIMITEPSISTDECKELVSNLVSNIYEQATGKKIDVEIEPYCTLEYALCEECKDEIIHSYKCSICKRTFCYDHRLPESHGCSRNSIYHPNIVVNGTNAPIKKKISIKRMLCG